VTLYHLSGPELRQKAAHKPASLAEVLVGAVAEAAHTEHHAPEVRPLLFERLVEVQRVGRQLAVAVGRHAHDHRPVLLEEVRPGVHHVHGLGLHADLRQSLDQLVREVLGGTRHRPEQHGRCICAFHLERAPFSSLRDRLDRED